MNVIVHRAPPVSPPITWVTLNLTTEEAVQLRTALMHSSGTWVIFSMLRNLLLHFDQGEP